MRQIEIQVNAEQQQANGIRVRYIDRLEIARNVHYITRPALFSIKTSGITRTPAAPMIKAVRLTVTKIGRGLAKSVI